MREDDQGALMLLAALLLAIGFLAVSILSARVAQVPAEAAAEASSGFGDELAALHRGVCASFAAIMPPDTARFQALLDLFEQQEAQRGYVASLSGTVTAGAFSMTAILSDTRTTASTSWDSAGCP